MGSVSMPLVPDGPVRTYFERLHALHLAAGQPSMRQLQRATRSDRRPRGVNPTTIHDILSAPRVARWDVVEAVVGALGSDVTEFAALWQEARRAALTPPTAGTGMGSPTPESPAIQPRELPPDVFAFTGRQHPLARIHDVLAAARDQPVVGICAISGTAGVGKTALAVHWAHQVADRFPDGQLYIDLRGYDPHATVLSADALARFLRALGTAGDDIAYELDERAARYRSLLASRRVLVVLDNAGSPEQVRPLLPGSSSCFVLVTSRDSLAGLIARHGAHRVELDVLSTEDASVLLRSLVGRRAEAEPAATSVLAELCSRLPLALRVAAELVAERPAATLAELAADLADQRHLLDVLDAGADEGTGVRSVFSWSYRHLNADTARMFRLLGINPGGNIEARAAGALAGDPVGAGRLLDQLARAHLVQRTGSGRYAMHDLLRAYAVDAAGEESEDERRAALTRLLDHYLAHAARAMDAAFPAERPDRPRVRVDHVLTAAVNDAEAGRRWLDSEREELVSVVEYAARHGWPRHAIALAATLFRYLQNGAHHAEAVSVHTAALEAARELGDQIAMGGALTDLGSVWWRWGQCDRAGECLGEALAMFEAAGDRAGQARVRKNIGALHWQRGRYEQAAASCRDAVAGFAVLGDRHGEARALDNLGSVRHRQGRYPQAAEHHRRALAVLREIGDLAGEARALDHLGSALRGEGHDEQAAEHHRRALAILCEIGDRAGEAQAMTNLAGVRCRQGDLDLAAELLGQVLAITAGIGSRPLEASAHNELGEVLRAQGEPGAAEDEYRAALALAEAIGDPYESARALAGIGHTRFDAGNVALAHQHWQRSLAIFEQLGVPEAGAVATAAARCGNGVPGRRR
jgi:tetratricopeptide (TPR) repeat protein